MPLKSIEELMTGFIDMNIHHSPDPKSERRMDAFQLAIQAKKAGMAGIVLKSHDYPTTPVAYKINQIVKGGSVFGSITLNLEVGGLNIHVLETSAKIGAEVVWMPTLTSYNDMKPLEQ